MDWSEAFDRLDFNNHGVRDKKIEAIATIELESLVNNWQWIFEFKRQLP